jgi:TetR/AcrR family transcriptional regulator, lmrAB and yxaGH operons repressor
MTADTRTRMIETTARLLQHRGYHGTSLSDILEASGAPRGSLYFHFPGGKEQLAIEATRAAVEESTEALRHALAEAKTPAKAVRHFMEEAAKIMHSSDYSFGCPVAPLILDAAAGVDELAELCRQAFETWVGMLRQAFVDAGIPPRRAEALALLVDSSIEGLLLITRASRDCRALTIVAVELEKAIEAAIPPRRRKAPRRPSKA